MSRVLVVALMILGTASAARATAASAPASPRVRAGPAHPAPADERARLDGDLAKLEGLARAEHLLAFVATSPDDPRAAAAAAEAKRLVAEARARAADDPELDAIDAMLSADEATRRAKIDLVAATRDTRALPVLAYVAGRDAQAQTRAAAARSLGRFGAAAEGLAAALAFEKREHAWLPASRDQLMVRAAAVAALGDIGTPSAGEALARLAQDTDEPEQLRQAAADTLHAHFPALAARLHLGRKLASSSGRLLGTVVGALSGGYALALVGVLSPSPDAGLPVGLAGGLVIGGTTMNLLARSHALSQGDAGYLLSAAAWSAPVGVFLGSAAGGPTAACDGNGCAAIMLGTHVAAMTGAWLTRQPLHLSINDDVELNLVAGAATLATIGGLAQLTPTSDQRLGAVLLALGPTAGFIAGTAFAHDLALTGPLAGMALLGAAEGALAGRFLGDGLVPQPLAPPSDRHDTQVAGLTYLGAGLGLGSVLAASTSWRPTRSDAFLALFGAIDGNLLGSGLHQLAGAPSSPADEAWPGFGGLLGTGVAIGLARPLHLKLDDGDLGLITLGEGFAAWQGFGWGAYLGDRDLLSAGTANGVALTATGLAGLGLVALSQRVDWTAWRAGWLFSGALWGAWLAGWSADVLEKGNGDGILVSALVGSDLGLAVSALAVSPLVGVDPSTLAWISIGGVAGMSLATMGAVFLAYDPSSTDRPVATANVIGTVVGLVAGGLFAHKLEGSGGDGPALKLPQASWLRGVPLPLASLAPLTSADGRSVSGLSAQLLWSL